MKQKQLEEGRISDHGGGLGTVDRSMIRRRAREIAVINGRGPNQILDSDIEQARRELQGKERLNPLPTVAENLPESKRWDPVPGTAGHKAPRLDAPDEQTFAELLVEEGMADAEHDQQVRAARMVE
jgi:hypothetical protein